MDDEYIINDLNDQIEELKRNVIDLESELEDARRDYRGAKEDADDYRDEIRQLERDIRELEEQVAENQVEQGYRAYHLSNLILTHLGALDLDESWEVSRLRSFAEECRDAFRSYKAPAGFFDKKDGLVTHNYNDAAHMGSEGLLLMRGRT